MILNNLVIYYIPESSASHPTRQERQQKPLKNRNLDSSTELREGFDEFSL